MSVVRGTNSSARTDTVLFIGLVLMAASLPLYRIASTPFLVALAVMLPVHLVMGGWHVLRDAVRARPAVCWMLALGGLYLASALWSTDGREAMVEVIDKLPLVLVPLVVGSLRWDRRRWQTILLVFVLACLVAFAVCMVHRTWVWSTTGEASFLYEDLVRILWMHPTYLALQLNAALVATAWLVRERRLRPVVGVVIAVLLVAFVLLLTVRLQILVSMVVLAWSVMHLVQRRRTVWLALGGLVLALSLTVAVVEPLRMRFYYARTFEYEITKENPFHWNGLNVRLAIWSCAADAIAERPVFGHGVGDDHQALLAAYEQRGFTFGRTMDYTAHNAYVQAALAIGVVGAGLLVVLLAAMWWTAPSWLTRGITLVFAATGVTESFLNMQTGVVVFAVFASLVLLHERALR